MQGEGADSRVQERPSGHVGFGLRPWDHPSLPTSPAWGWWAGTLSAEKAMPGVAALKEAGREGRWAGDSRRGQGATRVGEQTWAGAALRAVAGEKPWD